MSGTSNTRKRDRGNVQIKETKTGRSFVIRYRTKDGERISETVGRQSDGCTVRDAERVLADRLAEIRLGTWVHPRAAPVPAAPEQTPTFGEMAEAWLAERGISITDEDGRLRLVGDAYAKSTLTRFRVTVKDLIDYFRVGGSNRPMRVDEITREDVRKWIKRKTDGGWKPSTVKKAGALLVGVLDLAIEEDVITKNVARGPVRNLPAGKPRQTYLSYASEIEDLLAAAKVLDGEQQRGKGRRHVFIALLVFGGLRISEALAVRWRHVHLADGALTVPGTKTEKAARQIHLLPPLREALIVAKPADADPNAFVCATVTGRQQNKDTATQKWFKPAVREADEIRARRGEDPLPDLTPHGLRHTCVSLLSAVGWELTLIADHVGHEDIGFTHRTYRHTMSRKDGELERLALLVGAPSSAGGGLDEVLRRA